MATKRTHARSILDEGVREHQPSKVFAMFSGGDDSLTATHLASRHPLFAGAIHIDTRTGVRETRDFVEETCAREGWPLKVYSPPPGEYERLVLEGHKRRDGALLRGFPSGPSSHGTMYYFLKQKQIRRAVLDHKTHRLDRIGLVTGVRVAESSRRRDAKLARFHYVDDRCTVWLQPILDWTKADCLDYLAWEEVPRNPVSINCHRSGECLCGALATNAELAEIAFFYPEVGRRFERLAEEVRARGIPNDQWAGGPTAYRRQTARSNMLVSQPLCTQCVLPFTEFGESKAR